MQMTRRRVLAALVFGAVVVAGGGLGASTWVKSPQEAAAEADPPEPSVITSVVERRVLRETVTLRGSVVPGRTIEIAPVGGPDTSKMVVSAPMPKVGTRVGPGKVLAVVSGRPIIALRGKVPAYRDLHDGYQGSDVQQLQVALRELGYAVSDATGTYGRTTQAAVSRLYRDRGFEPVTEKVVPEKTSEDDGKKAVKPREAIVFPGGEVQFVPRFPARVTEVKAQLGAEVKGVLMKLATGDLAVTGSLPRSERKLVRTGASVKIFSEELGQTLDGTVVSIGAFDSGGEDGSAEEGGQVEPGHPILVKARKPLSERFAGQDVRLTISAASTKEPILAVPVSAIYAVADGSLQVIKITNGGSQTRITVTLGVTAGGFAEVSGEGLMEGDKVVVGGSG